MPTRRKNRCTDYDTHRYRRFVSIKGKALWKCMDCTSFTYNPTHLIGNKARCFHCNTEFTITPDKLTYAKVKCGQNTTECMNNLSEVVVDQVLGGVGQDDASAAEARRRLIELAFDESQTIVSREKAIVAEALKGHGSRSDSEQDDGLFGGIKGGE